MAFIALNSLFNLLGNLKWAKSGFVAIFSQMHFLATEVAELYSRSIICLEVSTMLIAGWVFTLSIVTFTTIMPTINSVPVVFFRRDPKADHFWIRSAEKASYENYSVSRVHKATTVFSRGDSLLILASSREALYASGIRVSLPMHSSFEKNVSIPSIYMALSCFPSKRLENIPVWNNMQVAFWLDANRSFKKSNTFIGSLNLGATHAERSVTHRNPQNGQSFLFCVLLVVFTLNLGPKSFSFESYFAAEPPRMRVIIVTSP